MNENNIDWIKTVKLQEDGYLVNETILVPKADGNRQYEDLKIWLETNTPQDEFTQDELDLQKTIKSKQNKINSLKKGFITNDTLFWFNEKYGLIFEQALSTSITLGDDLVTWNNANRQTVSISIEQSKLYLSEIKKFIKNIHFGIK